MQNYSHKLGRIGILMGGYSSEREISLKSCKAIYDALMKEQCDAVPLDITDSKEEKIIQCILEKKIDVAFIALHGCLGEDGTIQAILEKLEIPYTGSNPNASRLALDKSLAQELFKKNNLPVPKFISVAKKDFNLHQKFFSSIDFLPIIVKPACEGSSIGITLVKTKKDLEKAMQIAWEYGDKLLIEEYIKGRELTVGILDQRPLPIIEIRYQNDLFDFHTKYHSSTTEYIVPAPVSGDLTLRIQQTALQAYHTLGCCDLSRVDFMLGDDGSFYLLEINTIPGFTSMSLLPKAAQAAGITFPQLCLKLVGLAYGKKKTRKTTTVSY